MIKTILIVEDDIPALLLTEKVICSMGYKTITAKSGEEAVDISFKTETINLILMDICLNDGIDGAEAARQILSFRNIPVIFYTSYTDAESADKVRGIKNYGYVVKSTGAEVLKISVESAFKLIESEEQNNECVKLLEVNEQKYHLFFTNSTFGLAHFDYSGIIIECNTVFKNLFPIQNDEFVGYELFKSTDTRLTSAIRKTLSGGITFYEDSYKSGDSNQPIPVNVKFEPLITSDKEIHGGLIIVEKKRKWRQIEDALYENKDIFRQTFHQNKAMMLMMKPENGQILDANKAAENFYGYSIDELRRMTIMDINTLPPEEIKTEIDHALKEERNYFIFPHKLAGGEIKTVEVFVSPVTIKGNTLLISIIHDVTERRLLENKVNALLKEKEIILKEVHHRIKNNMSAIMGLLMLQQDFLTDIQAIEALRVAESRVQSMIVLYDKLFLRSDEHEQPVKEYFSALADEIVSLFQNKNLVKIEKHIDDFKLGHEKLFPVGIAVNEILTNIMKYAFAGRDSGLIIFNASVKDNTAVIVIKDNGVGLSGSADFESTSGFGFQLIHMMMEQINGEAEIESGNGTRFILQFHL